MSITTSVITFPAFEPFLQDYGVFVGMVFGALLLGVTPLKAPFQWLETYYHELSHGLISILTFGKIGRIKLNLNGSGWCSTRGGSRFLILLAGYMGAALWGAYIYLAGWKLGDAGAVQLLWIELCILAITIILWVRDPITLAILLSAGALYYVPIRFEFLAPYVSHIMQFIGIYVMLNAIRAPFHLIDGQHVGDGAALADLTIIFPEGVWILWWIIFAIFMLAVCAFLTLPGMNILLWWYY